MTWTLDNAEQRHREAPDTFEIPSRDRRHQLKPHDLVKLIFHSSEPCHSGRFAGASTERMWVEVTRVERKDIGPPRYFGELSNKPHFVVGLQPGDEVEFRPWHVTSLDRVRCVECAEPTPAYTKGDELLEQGWGSRPYPKAPEVTMYLCPDCKPAPN